MIKRIDLIAGARPNFMKIASIIRAIESRRQSGSTLSYRLIHTGQHYDVAMSEGFFVQLGIPKPDINLEVGSGSQAKQTAAIMVGYEDVLLKEPSDLCLVVGDVNSTMACAIVAQKQGIKVAHVEGGIRSQDWSMPEEINRIVTDSISNYFFTTSESANANLRKMGMQEHQIVFVGNTMIDTLLAHQAQFQKPPIWDELLLESKGYFVLTLHRPSNVDNVIRLQEYLNTIGDTCQGYHVVFPAHPRTAKKIQELGCVPKNIHIIGPQPYLEFNYLVQHAKAVITDSGGVTEESTVMHVPCLTLRDNTERPETVMIGTNELIGTDPAKLKPALDKVLSGCWKQGQIPPMWDGKAGQRIVEFIEGL